MRILAIRGKNLASLADAFEISLDDGPLAQVGLFAITGQTGAGKSTILDALCLALYDKIPRLPDGHGFAVGHRDEDENLRVTSNDVRSILRRGTASAFAEVDFVGKDKHAYRARWDVGKARGKATGRLQPQDITLTHIATGQRIGQGKKSTLEAISEKIDLNFDQFRRSVLLAQGDFAAFLKAKKDDRSNLLERITGTDIYSELSIAAFERAKQEKEALRRIEEQLQDQIPLAEPDRQALEQERDQCIALLADLEKAISSNQQILDWYAALNSLKAAEQAAGIAFETSQQAWNDAQSDRLLIEKVEAAQPVRPLLAHYEAAMAEVRDAQQTLKISGELQETAELGFNAAKHQMAVASDALQAAEKTRLDAQPLLRKARDLDTRIEIMQADINALNAEQARQQEQLAGAQAHHQGLLAQQTERTNQLQRLDNWLEENQALKPVAAEWSRWQGELERYQMLTTRKAENEVKLKACKHSAAGDECQMAEIKKAIIESRQEQDKQQAMLEPLKQQAGQYSLEGLNRAKDDLEIKRGQVGTGLKLAHEALALQQALAQDSDKLAAIEQVLTDAAEQLQTATRQQSTNVIALEEAKKSLALIQAIAHKNAQEFRDLLQPDQPCPVCGALEHPWRNHDRVDTPLEDAQQARVKELESEKVALIKSIAGLQKLIDQKQEQKSALAQQMAQAQEKLADCHNEWRALVLPDKTGLALTDAGLLPLLEQQAEQLTAEWEQVKQQEKQAIELQKQIEKAQALFDASKQKLENLMGRQAALDSRLAESKANMNHFSDQLQEAETQLSALTGLLQVPFGLIDGWQSELMRDADRFRQSLAAQVSQWQQAEQDIQTIARTLADTNREEELAAQSLQQSRQLCHAKQAEITLKTEEKQRLSEERNALLPDANDEAVDSYEQALNRKVQAARTAYEQAGNDAVQAETDLATQRQNQRHWQAETGRRSDNLEKANAVLNQALAKQGIDLDGLKQLLEKDEAWLSGQKAKRTALEQALRESAALLKVKTDDRRRHETRTPLETEELARQIAQELLQQRQLLNSQKEEKLILLREDDKKISAGSHLKAELDKQQACWQQWESLNELIGSKSGAKFRSFAQSLTLEALLAHSNRHLEDFARRYRLQRVPGSELELQIIDRDMADDVRSVHSLSGGESFLVSLALALGLASLSSNKTQVESLFIDEGFGSLDPETLDIAIASLDTLQALGRKVGIISHVPILVERIGARVVVEKQGGGKSRVFVEGNC
ncbi:AAA family ATPase [Methylobacter sp. YRD-M1]|uniref:AAA family ATPase n=1 Tax=Methylobacter sp. YRD-M1 TaxID=2911520 RepID=UPI00227B548A|nr:AAA family ATPase [Methylobacter sp. YRD-M1]WAK03470.1 AAA family ATPase [Methylobacter sp. YRD-M1]